MLLSQALCGHCAQCREGEPAYCVNAARLSLGGRREDGSTPLSDDHGPISGNFVGQSSFATHAVAKARNAFRVDADIPLELLAPIGCGVMTGAGAIFNDARSQPGSTVAVFGCGTVGLAAVMAAKVAGAERIVAVDVRTARLGLATKLGATHTVLSDDDVVEAVHAISGGGVDAAVEASGVPRVATDAVASTHTRGLTVIVGAAPFGSRFDADWWTLAAGRRVQGSVIGSSDPAVDLPRLIELWRAGDLPLEHLVTPYPFTEINAAVAAMASGDVVKPVVVMARRGGRRMSSPGGNLFVDGAWTDGGGDVVELVDPSRNLPFATVSLVDEAGIDRAVASARAAFDGGGWSGRSVAERAEPLSGDGGLPRGQRRHLRRPPPQGGRPAGAVRLRQPGRRPPTCSATTRRSPPAIPGSRTASVSRA